MYWRVSCHFISQADNFLTFYFGEKDKSILNKATGLKAFKFIESRLQHRCIPVNIVKMFKDTMNAYFC